MKIVRIHTDEGISYGGVEPEGVRLYQGSPLVAWEPTEVVVPFAEAHLLAPVFPTKVVAVGRNYVAHADETGSEVPNDPIIFIKPATSVIGPGHRWSIHRTRRTSNMKRNWRSSSGRWPAT